MSVISRLERDKRRAENKNDLREAANLSNLLGRELQQVGDYDGALNQHREEAALCESLGDTVGVAVSHRRMGEVYCEMGKWEKALHHQNRHLSLAKEAESLVEEQRAHATIGRTYLQRAEEAGTNVQKEEALAEAERAFLRSLSTCERLKGSVDTQEHSQMRCRLYLNLGLVLDYRGNTKKAMDFIGQALELCTNHSLREDAQRCHSALGVIQLREGLLTEALQQGQKALALSVKLHNKAFQCEGHVFLAQVHLMNSDYEAAKKCYYKAYKLKHPDLADRNRIEKNLKTVVSVCLAEDALVTQSKGKEKLKLYEKLGDGLADLGFYSQSLDYYHKMLEEAQGLNKSPEFLAPIYMSLARTYGDNKQYKEAKEFYLKEYNIKVKEDYSEACKTLMSIADVSEGLGETVDALSITYQKARELAIKAANPKLEVHVLRQHISLEGIPKSLKNKLEEEINNLLNEHNLDSEPYLSDEENDSEDEIDLDLVSFSDSENESENFDRPRHLRQKKSYAVKRNEKGETPLHKACIDGNINMVKKLLQQGHPVNPRDNCGWLPLHEAANHGYYEIVVMLIDAGAWISDRGGDQCDGITPIHDAAACGNFDIVRLLMTRGASVTAKTNDGDTPLESLVNYRMRARLSLAEEEICMDLEGELRNRMKQAGHKIPVICESNSSRETGREEALIQKNSNDRMEESKRRSSDGDAAGSYSRSQEGEISSSFTRRRSSESASNHKSSSERERKLQSRKLIDREKSDEEEEDLPDIGQEALHRVFEGPSEAPCSDGNSSSNDEEPEEIFNPLLEDLYRNEESATGTYLNAIGSVGSAARRAELRKNSSGGLSFKKDKKHALVTNENDVGDDWLDDDMKIFSKKRKRMGKLEFEYKEPRKEKKVFSENTGEVKSLPRSKKSQQVKLTSLLQRYPEKNKQDTGTSVTSEDESEVFLERTTTSTLSESDVATSSSKKNSDENLNNTLNETTVARGGALRLRVRVQNRVLLVPVAGAGQDRTVGWLAEEVSRRYYQLCGLRPHLSLTTQDGAVLDPSDPILLVLPNEQSELQAQVTGWDLPPLPDRYAQACQALGCIPLPSLNTILHRTEASTTLDLSHIRRLTAIQLQPILRAVQFQQSLRSLTLASIRLGDDGFHYLIEALPSLPLLESLDLRSSSITSCSLIELTEAISSSKLSLKTLGFLDMSYNTLSGAKIANIGLLLNLPALTVLSLKYCCLSLTGEQQLPVHTSGIRTLSLDYNTINDVALASLLSQVPQITTLTLSGLNCRRHSPSDTHSRLGMALSSVLGAGEECMLQHLDLSACNLMNADLEDISAYLYRCPHLVSINLAHNPDLTSTSISTLLGELTTNIILPLASLSLHGNHNEMSDLYNKVITTLRHKAATKHPITKLSLPVVNDAAHIENFWKCQYQQNASVAKYGSEMFLSCDK